MSSPTRRGSGFDDRLTYAPPWARGRFAADLPTRVPVLRLPPAPQLLVQLEPERLEAPDLVPFEGDIAIKELRRQLALHPETMPEPLHRAQPVSMKRIIARWSLVIALAALIAFAAIVLQSPEPAQSPVALSEQRAAAPPRAKSVARVQPPEIGSARPLDGAERHAPVNAPLPLGIALDGAAVGAAIVISGLAAGTRLAPAEPAGSAGWRVSVPDLAKVLVHPPKDFVGSMDAVIDLELADGTIADRRRLRLEWNATAVQLPATLDAGPQPDANLPPVNRTIGPEEIAILIRRGHEFLTNGDIAAARLVLRRAAEAGSAHAALTLGVSFDPIALKQVGVVGIAPDAAEARRWYQKAAELGSAEATRRLVELARAGR